MSSSRIGVVGTLFLFVFSLGCAPMIRTEVHTLSDRAPAAAASFHVVLDEDQASDLESSRLASRIDTAMTRAGYRRVGSDADADLSVRFQIIADTALKPAPSSSPGVSVSRGTTTSTSRTSVAGVPVPLGGSRTTTHHGYEVSTEAPTPPASGAMQRYRLELEFVDESGPSHKVTVSATSTHRELRELAPCLIDAAFRDFPLGDGQKRTVSIAEDDCSVG